MPNSIQLKRQNFNVTPEQEAELLTLQTELDAPSVKDAIFKAARIALFLRREVKLGRRIGLTERTGTVTEIIFPDIESSGSPRWNYLVERPHAWKKQLFVKGRRLTAAQVWIEMQTNGMSEGDAAANWELPEEAISEIVAYCRANGPLIKMEADEERLYLLSEGIRLSA